MVENVFSAYTHIWGADKICIVKWRTVGCGPIDAIASVAAYWEMRGL